jgi:hypothetical protein
MNEKNLRILGEYLISLPDDYKYFDMSDFCKSLAEIRLTPDQAERGKIGDPLWHAIKAGIKPKSNRAKTSWVAFCYEAMGISFCGIEGDWCFSPRWELADNSPQGAGRRIFWLLEHGLPDDWHEQMFAEAELCYLNYKRKG